MKPNSFQTDSGLKNTLFTLYQKLNFVFRPIPRVIEVKSVLTNRFLAFFRLKSC